MLSNRIGLQTLDAAKAHLSLAWLEAEYGPGPQSAVFDFDGVLTSPIEDLAYKLPESTGERAILEREAKRYSISAELYGTRYLRHLVLQAALEERRELPEAGPLLGLARELTDTRQPFFILTARSGRAAVGRLMAYLDHHRLEPQEIFCVGRVPKGRQLALVGSTVPNGTRVIYFEDTVRHARNSNKQDNPAVSTVLVSWDPSPWQEAMALVSRVLHLSVDASAVRKVA